jgi:hypothetical protein
VGQSVAFSELVTMSQQQHHQSSQIVQEFQQQSAQYEQQTGQSQQQTGQYEQQTQWVKSAQYKQVFLYSFKKIEIKKSIFL